MRISENSPDRELKDDSLVEMEKNYFEPEPSRKVQKEKGAGPKQ